jgi:predicted transcriptional regulator
LKLSQALKRRIATLAKATGVSAHAFMVEALERQASAAELQQSFHEDALQADAEMQRKGTGYSLDEVERWLRARAAGRRARAPRAVSWR